MKYIRFIHISFLLAITVMLAGCRDDALGDFGDIEEGVASVSVKLSWDRGDEVGIDSRAGDPGDMIQDIKSLYMFIYDKDGNLYKDRYYTVTDENSTHDSELKNVNVDNGDNREDNEKGENGLGDALQGRAQFDMELPRGEYYIYAVANVNVPALDKEKYSTREKLKAISFDWDLTDTGNNSQMFGVFSLNTPNRKATDAAPLRINAKSVMIHSWVRRLASKVTVAFDGSELYDNVQVYIETITIHDIPQRCTLGNENHPGGSELAPKDRYSVLHKTGKTITVQEIPEGANYITPATFLHVCNSSHPYLGKGDESTPESVKDEMHKHESESLFFYENMQGTGKSKKQSQDGTHIDFDTPVENDVTSGWKDNKPFGTYIEVAGFYRCVSADGSMGSGPIKYRYMLGKGDTDYNAERNTHYKLTLKLKGYGNDYDWHIDYQTTTGLHVTNPQYISYLYNKRMNATVKMVGAIPDDYVLRAEIVECSWKPYGDGSEDFPLVKDIVGHDGITRQFCYNGVVDDDGPWNSFLSLRQTNVVKVEVPGFKGGASQSVPDSYISSGSNHYIKTDYNTSGGVSQGLRDYEITEGQHSSNTEREGVYNVSVTKRSSNGTPTERVFTIPIFTRAKELVTKSGFTGNNPFYSYPRHGKIKFSIVNPKTGETYGDPVYLDMIQVRRLLNPKGVWRKKGSTEKFHVRLMRLESLDGSEFKPFKSIGKWSAEIVTQSDPIVTLSSTTDGSGDNAPQNGSRIEGEDECYIDFDINFNGSTGCAIVKIRYHNYTCEHDIFVREGYDPIDVAGKGTLWTSFNVDHFEKVGDKYKAVPTTSPIAEGSLFRRTSHVAILQSNNNLYPRCVRPAAEAKFAVHDPDSNTTEMTWDEIISKKKGDYNKWEILGDKENEHIAANTDVYGDQLISESANDNSFPVAKSYGIVYADGATETLTSVKEATGYDGTNPAYGMMGVIVYNLNTCNQIFFPLGTEWHGHRKHGGGWRNNDTNGTLRYASRSEVWGHFTSDLGTLKTRPLFYDLYERPGAIYWLRDRVLSIPEIPIEGNSGTKYRDGTKSCALDMNFYTMGFEGYMNDAASSNEGTDSHACFIRTVISSK